MKTQPANALLVAMLWLAASPVPAQQQPYGGAGQQQLTPQQIAQQRQLAQQQQAAQQATAQTPQGQMGQPDANGQVRVPLVTTDQAVEMGEARTAVQPFPQLTPQEQQYLDDVLKVWESRTNQVTRYECDFRRWQYDPTVFDKGYASVATGKIKFMDPDKGLFRVDEQKFLASKVPEPVYEVDSRRQFGEYWICDGNWIHIRDRNEKKETQIEIPPSMRGEQIHLSPLPFLFGVNAVEIQQRYWIRPVRPPEGDDGVWLEAWPKRADDAGNYSRVQVVLDKTDILPRALIVYLPNWRPERPHQEIYEFTNRKTPDGLWDTVKEKLFLQEFIPTKLTSDWKVIKKEYVPPQPADQQRVAQPTAGGNVR